MTDDRMAIQVRHNVEMAHRLFTTPGKCQNIHGHSWIVVLSLAGKVNAEGILEGVDFGDMKQVFRHYLDTHFDHHVLLNQNDPLAGTLAYREPWKAPGEVGDMFEGELHTVKLPGLATMLVDPTTENFAAHIGQWAINTFGLAARVRVNEGPTNSAVYPAEGYAEPS